MRHAGFSALLAAALCWSAAAPARADFLILKTGAVVEGKIYRQNDMFVYLFIAGGGNLQVRVDDVDFDAMQTVNYQESRAKPKPVEPEPAPAESSSTAGVTGRTDETSEGAAEEAATPEDASSAIEGYDIAIVQQIYAVLKNAGAGESAVQTAARQVTDIPGLHVACVFVSLMLEQDTRKIRVLAEVMDFFPESAANDWLKRAIAAKSIDLRQTLTAIRAIPKNGGFLDLTCTYVMHEEVAVRRDVQTTIARILQANPKALDRAKKAMKSATGPSHVAAILLALAGSRIEGMDLFLAGYVDPSANPEVRAAALQGLGMQVSFDPASIERLMDALDYSLDADREQAAKALRQTRSYDAVPALIELLEDDHAGVRQAAYGSLQALTGSVLTPDAERWRQWWDVEGERSQSVMEDLESRFSDSQDAEVRARAIEGLTRYSRYLSEDFVQEVRETLEDSDTRLVMACIIFLKSRFDLPSVPYLIDLLESSDVQVKSAAYDALKTLTVKDFPADPRVWSAWWETFDVKTGMNNRPVEAIDEYNEDNGIQPDETEDE